MRAAGAVVIAIATIAGAGVHGQRLAFEVASIKPASPDPNNVSDLFEQITVLPGGRLTTTNASVRAMLRRVYSLRNSEIAESGPAWISTDKFNITARAASDSRATRQQTLDMLRALLEDRFKLQVRFETRELPVYHLLLARDDGRLGPRITRSPLDCAALRAQREAEQARNPTAPPAPVALQPGDPRPAIPVCGSMMNTGGEIGYNGSTMADLARQLSSFMGRTVVDMTGLAGGFELTLSFDPEVVRQMNREIGLPEFPGSNTGVMPPSDKPPIMVALQEQLGLKLESRRGPVQILVIDRAEPPVPD
jgi:uncharacterized protein (TIGR03435 family)